MRVGSKKKFEADQIVSLNFRRLRYKRRMSQQQVAERIGLSFQQIQKYEGGRNRLSAGLVVLLARILEVDIMEFYSGIASEDRKSGQTSYAGHIGGTAQASHRAYVDPHPH